MVRRISALVMVPLVLALAACTGGTPEPQPTLPAMWQTEFDRLLNGKSINDFERDILKDYRITDAEYAEAREAFRVCATDAGFDVVLTDSGIDMGPGPELVKKMPNTDDQAKATDDILNTCEQGTTFNVGRLYEGMRGNPDGLSSADHYRTCFERNEVHDADGLSAEQLIELVTGDQSLLSEGARACLNNPNLGR